MMSFANSWAFILLPLPLLVYFFVKPARVEGANALKVPFFKAVESLATTAGSGFRKTMQWRQWVACLIWILLVIALAGPQWLGDSIPLARNGRNIMLLIDLSSSMGLPDFTFGGRHAMRLDVVKKVAGRFIDGRKGDRVGMVVFGTKPYLRVPLTFDLQTAHEVLDDTSIGLAGDATAIGDAIALGVKHLQDAPAQSRVMVLLTDGGDNSSTISPTEATQLAAKQGIKIYSIGIGADRLIVSTPLGPQIINPSSDLDEETLKEIAQTTGAKFFRAKDEQALEQIYQAIDKLEPVSEDQAFFRPSVPLYPWPLAVALFLSMLLALRKIVWKIRFTPSSKSALLAERGNFI
jgi:Ca-activated chloride channel family protein